MRERVSGGVKWMSERGLAAERAAALRFGASHAPARSALPVNQVQIESA
jgi:hypothetical protein